MTYALQKRGSNMDHAAVDNISENDAWRPFLESAGSQPTGVFMERALFSFVQVAISPEPRITKLFTVLVRQVEEQGAFKDVKAVCDGKNIFTARPLPSDEMVISGVELPKKEYVVSNNARVRGSHAELDVPFFDSSILF
jgi:hypothetical protein